MILKGSSTRGDASFDLTPMIDVLLLLIVFFMLTSQFSRSEQMPLHLPGEQGDHAVDEQKPMELIIDMDRNGGLYVQGREVRLDGLPALLGVASAEVKGARPVVVVRADRAAPARFLNRLGQELVRLGVTMWKLGTAPEGLAPTGAP